jgi:regulator of protease activity HflC (stomatin/prohibitin superfamily)
MVVEKPFKPGSGWLPLLVFAYLLVGGPVVAVIGNTRAAGLPEEVEVALVVAAVVGVVVSFFVLAGLQAIAPNEARVYLLFGTYKGTTKTSGFYFVNPFFTKHKVSLRVRNFETGSEAVPTKKNEAGKVVEEKRSAGRPSKVNDRDGNPVEISAVVVWRVVDTAEALFEVDDYEHYVAVQSESALRNLASRHPYDSHTGETSLRGDTHEVSDQLRHDIQERLGKAGVEVIEARISHLAYAPEIAAAMLQRQQAQAVVAARTQIVEGAVGMVEMALHRLQEQKIVELADDRRAALVSNLLVVLCSDRHTQPIVNTGTH